MIEKLKKEFPELSETQMEKFDKLLKIFMETNSQINLSAIRDEEGIIQKHFLDSLMLVDYIDLEWNGLDLWSWWGFPGLPLKIFFGDKISMTMVDSVAKKMKCVDNFVENLELKETKTKVWRAESLWKDWEYREKFDFVVSRAMAYFPTLLEYALPFVEVWGYFIAYKLENKEELKEWKKALHMLWGVIEKVENYEIDGQKRSFVFVKKIKRTPAHLPRAIGEPLKNPIKWAL